VAEKTQQSESPHSDFQHSVYPRPASPTIYNTKALTIHNTKDVPLRILEPGTPYLASDADIPLSLHPGKS
jgi:hypothetical protein